jgi:hypothetical protein
VFKEYGLVREKHLNFAITDAGSDVKRCCDVLMVTVLYGWCFSHMLSTALKAVFGSKIMSDGNAGGDVAGSVVDDDNGIVELMDDDDHVSNIKLLRKLIKKVQNVVGFFHSSKPGSDLLGELLDTTYADYGLHPFSKLAQNFNQRYYFHYFFLIN